nr:hypothetical protein [Candidatus Sigynarchaeota archaeon]
MFPDCTVQIMRHAQAKMWKLYHDLPAATVEAITQRGPEKPSVTQVVAAKVLSPVFQQFIAGNGAPGRVCAACRESDVHPEMVVPVATPPAPIAPEIPVVNAVAEIGSTKTCLPFYGVKKELAELRLEAKDELGIVDSLPRAGPTNEDSIGKPRDAAPAPKEAKRLHAIARLGTRLQFFTLAMLAIIGVTNLMRSMDTERLDVGGRWGIFVSIIAAAFILIFIFSGINAVYRRCIARRAKIMTTFHRGTRAVPKKQSAANIDEKPKEKKPKEKFVDKKVAKKLKSIAKYPVLSEQQAMLKKGNTFRYNIWNLRWFHERAQKTKAGLSLSHISTKT